jgi:chromosome partitioning protein
MIYAVVNTKGGVGKTTTAVHLATLFACQGSALMIDGDPQASAASWAAWRREAGLSGSPTTVCLSGKAVLDEGRQLAAGFDNVVIDAGGRDSSGLRSALILAQYAIIPVGASGLDAAAMTDLFSIVEMARDFNPDLDVRVLLARIDPRTRDTDDMVKFLAEQGLSVLKARICERVAFRRSVGDGAIVNESSRDLSAISEINALFREIQE